MTTRWKRNVALVGVLVFALAGVVTGEEEAPAKYGGEYLRFCYRTETAGGLVETITTEITPMADGRYEVVTTTEQITEPDEIRLGFFGGSFRWLGLYLSEDSGERFDLSSLDALNAQALEPHKRYLLPDGGLLQTGERVTVAGLMGIEGVSTHADVQGATITVVLADDLELRRLLPFPLRVRLDYEDLDEATGDEDPSLRTTYFSGSIELVELTRTRTDEDAP